MEKVTSADGTQIAFDRYGSGPGLILVPGATAHRAVDETTAELARLLAEHFTVIHYDRRGRGDSGDTLPYAVEREAEDIQALVEAVGGRAHAFGMSSGAVLALAAAQNGAALERLVLYEPPVLTHPDDPVDREYRGDLEKLLAAGRNGDAMARFMTMAGMPAEEVEGFRASPGWAPFEAVAPTLAYDAAVMDPFSRGEPIPPDTWDRVTGPALVLEGGDSPPFMRRGAAAVAEALPNAEVRSLPGQTHSFEPGVLAPVLVEFLGS
jgi:pimeloyl-ACP methyl ester carboxylesterase